MRDLGQPQPQNAGKGESTVASQWESSFPRTAIVGQVTPVPDMKAMWMVTVVRLLLLAVVLQSGRLELEWRHRHWSLANLLSQCTQWHYLKTCIITTFTKTHHFSPFWDRSIQSTHPPRPTSCRYILILPSHPGLGLQSGLFPSGFPVKTLYAYITSPSMSTACPTELILLNFITQKNIWWGIQITKILATQSSSLPCHLVLSTPVSNTLSL